MRTLLIATDLGETSAGAVRYGVQLARDLGARVLLVHAWQPTQLTVIDGSPLMASATP